LVPSMEGSEIRRPPAPLPGGRSLPPGPPKSHRPTKSAFALVQRRQQDKPLWRPPVVIRVPEGVLQVARRDELPVDQGRERGRVFAVLDPVDFESAFQAQDLVAAEQMPH